MSFSWTDYVHLAEILLNCSEEACLRSSVSRAYYGAFCIARNNKGFQKRKIKKGENIHWIVINEYRNSSDIKEQNAGRVLDKLRRARNDSDYNEYKHIDKNFAERMLLSAKDILRIIGTP